MAIRGGLIVSEANCGQNCVCVCSMTEVYSAREFEHVVSWGGLGLMDLCRVDMVFGLR